MATEYRIHGVVAETEVLNEHRRYVKLDQPRILVQIQVGKRDKLENVELSRAQAWRLLRQLVASLARSDPDGESAR